MLYEGLTTARLWCILYVDVESRGSKGQPCGIPCDIPGKVWITLRRTAPPPKAGPATDDDTPLAGEKIKSRPAPYFLTRENFMRNPWITANNGPGDRMWFIHNPDATSLDTMYARGKKGRILRFKTNVNAMAYMMKNLLPEIKGDTL